MQCTAALGQINALKIIIKKNDKYSSKKTNLFPTSQIHFQEVCSRQLSLLLVEGCGRQQNSPVDGTYSFHSHNFYFVYRALKMSLIYFVCVCVFAIRRYRANNLRARFVGEERRRVVVFAKGHFLSIHKKITTERKCMLDEVLKTILTKRCAPSDLQPVKETNVRNLNAIEERGCTSLESPDSKRQKNITDACNVFVCMCCAACV